MNDKELYKQKYRAQLDEWTADIAKMKAKASKAKADAQIAMNKAADIQVAMNKEVEVLELKLKDAEVKLSALADVSEEAWESVKKGVDSAWDTIKSAFHDAASKFKD